MNNLELYVEALVFASEHAVSIEDIKQTIQATTEQGIDQNMILQALGRIKEKYDNPDFAIALVNIAEGYQFLTKTEYHNIISQLQLQRSKKKLTQAALETLAIVAYRQPVTKLEIEQIRGVNCDYTLQKLLEKELISIAGKAETAGKPILYITSSLFMDYFGINSTAQLPQLKDIVNRTNEIGENTD